MVNKNHDSAPANPEALTSTFLLATRPRVVYAMAVWAFFGIGGFLSSILRRWEEYDPQVFQFATALELAFLALLTINVLRMQRSFLILFGVTCAMAAAWQTTVAGILIFQRSEYSVLYLFLFFVVPSTAFAVTALRPSFLYSAAKYRSYRDQEAIKKVALKHIGK